MTDVVAAPSQTDEQVLIAKKLNNKLHNSDLNIPRGFFFGRDPGILATRIQAAESIHEMPSPQEVSQELSTNFLAKAGNDFVENSSIHDWNSNVFASKQTMVALFPESVLTTDSRPYELDPFNIALGFYIDCRTGCAQNGQPYCNCKPRLSNAPDSEDFLEMQGEAMKAVGGLLDSEFWH
jgi:hypothetical protein